MAGRMGVLPGMRTAVRTVASLGARAREGGPDAGGGLGWLSWIYITGMLAVVTLEPTLYSRPKPLAPGLFSAGSSGFRACFWEGFRGVFRAFPTLAESSHRAAFRVALPHGRLPRQALVATDVRASQSTFGEGPRSRDKQESLAPTVAIR